MTGTLTLNADGTQSLSVPNKSAGVNATIKVPVLNGFATLIFPGSGNTLKVQLLQPPTALTAQVPTQQVSIGNDLPALPGAAAKLSFVTRDGAQIPALATLGGQAYR